MTYLDRQTGNVTDDLDLAIAMTGEAVVTTEVDLAAVELVIAGVFAPLPEVA